jgi:hypothetical protein
MQFDLYKQNGKLGDVPRWQQVLTSYRLDGILKKLDHELPQPGATLRLVTEAGELIIIHSALGPTHLRLISSSHRPKAEADSLPQALLLLCQKAKPEQHPLMFVEVFIPLLRHWGVTVQNSIIQDLAAVMRYQEQITDLSLGLTDSFKNRAELLGRPVRPIKRRN